MPLLWITHWMMVFWVSIFEKGEKEGDKDKKNTYGNKRR